MTRKLARAMAAVLATACIGLAGADDGAAWPEQVVAIEQLRWVTPMRLRAPGVPAKGAVEGPAVLRAHVDADGAVVRLALLESCGNPDLDEAALHALRRARFAPYLQDGQPTAVSLVVPVHIPKNLGRAH